ncbi:unnamed protein product [Adineta steineri]|uniref:Uncharacterized protein n=1 Tax=Adineta steineri TaxID=433720 RepID=A0A819ZHJ0_9BILA|nr:unnamed protein product [Adineta steineri]CAF4170054.1 unnamed protein product [Adineta steineri]
MARKASINNKQFKTLTEYWSNISSVRQGNINHYFAEAYIQTESTIQLSDYDEEVVDELIDVRTELFEETICAVESVVVDINTVCPRCKTKCTPDERIVSCSNSACGASFKRKTNFIRADITACDDGNECLDSIAYQDVLVESVGDIDKDTIYNFFYGQ